MRPLSISVAWEETRTILVRDGRLYVSVALALIALPTAINLLMNPNGVRMALEPGLAVGILAWLIALAGQLAIIRLALGPSITVGAAIGHGLRRVPFYFMALILLGIALFVIMIPMGVLLALLGVPITSGSTQIPATPATLVVGLIYLALIIFVGVRMILSAPVTSAEHVGPIAILRRSWTLTAGQWWPLFGFLAMFSIGAAIVLLAIKSALGVIAQLTIGAITPMSVSALVVALVQAIVSTAISSLFALMLARIYQQLAGEDRSAEVFR